MGKTNYLRRNYVVRPPMKLAPWSGKSLNGPGHEKTCFMLYANNKDADQPAHPRSLISVLVVRCFDSIIPILAICKISRL